MRKVYQGTDGHASGIFDVLRQEVPLEWLIEVNSSRKALCVAHDENTPSMHVYEDHVHCYGCGFHGDVVDMWAKRSPQGINRPIEAALDLAREFNIRLPEMSEEGRKKAEERRAREAANYESARGFHELVDNPEFPENERGAVKEWWEGRGFGAELRKRFLLGASKDGQQAIIPFWHRGRIIGFIRRKLEGEPSV
jgi:DNA primase